MARQIQYRYDSFPATKLSISNPQHAKLPALDITNLGQPVKIVQLLIELISGSTPIEQLLRWGKIKNGL